MSDQIPGMFSFSHPVRLAFQHLFTPREYIDRRTGRGDGKAKYDAMFIMPANHPELKAVKEFVSEIAKSQFPVQYAAYTKAIQEKQPYEVYSKILQFPFKSGDRIIADAEKTAKAKGKPVPDNSWLAGTVTLTARSIYAPMLKIVKGRAAVLVEDEFRAAAEPRFYNGVECLAELKFVPHEVGSNNPGVTAYLQAVIAGTRGEKITGGSTRGASFDQYIGRLSATDPTEGMADDEIPY